MFVYPEQAKLSLFFCLSQLRPNSNAIHQLTLMACLSTTVDLKKPSCEMNATNNEKKLNIRKKLTITWVSKPKRKTGRTTSLSQTWTTTSSINNDRHSQTKDHIFRHLQSQEISLEVISNLLKLPSSSSIGRCVITIRTCVLEKLGSPNSERVQYIFQRNVEDIACFLAVICKNVIDLIRKRNKRLRVVNLKIKYFFKLFFINVICHYC